MRLGKRLDIVVLIDSFVVAEYLVVLFWILRIDPLAQMLVIVTGLQIIRLLILVGAIIPTLVVILLFQEEAAGACVVQFILALLIS